MRRLCVCAVQHNATALRRVKAGKDDVRVVRHYSGLFGSLSKTLSLSYAVYINDH